MGSGSRRALWGKGLGWEISLCVECWQLSESDVPEVKMCASGPSPGQRARLLGVGKKGGPIC